MDSGKKQIIGWREWVSLPGLGIPAIKAKIDSGARTSAIDAEVLEIFRKDRALHARFLVKYGTRKNPKEKECAARIVEHRSVTNSGGHRERRVVISTHLILGKSTREIEITLAERAGMKFRMLIGRTAITPGNLLDIEKSYLTQCRIRSTDKNAEG